MIELITFLGSFLVVYLFYLFFVILRKKNKDKLKNGIEFRYLKVKYNFDVKEINIKKMSHVIALANSFIIATTVTIVSFIDNIILMMVIGFFILMILELITYHIIGTHYQKKKRGKKNV
ncbi:MAG: hypothetical protein PHI05_03215 [Bacilli bacterium]|nr:hypothetical protein [Bacilli bacterium]MDD4547731.1 hypothetical protein [Bacilli bacterium]